MSQNPTEHVQEEIRHEASHGGDEVGHTNPGGGGRASRWITAAATTAACLAAFAAVTGALATTHLTEATHRRIESNDKWSYYQSKSLKSNLLVTKDEILTALDHPPPPEDMKQINDYDLAKNEIRAEAEALQVLSMAHLRAHETFELAATMFHIAIAIVAISVVARRKVFWYGSIVLGAVGAVFLGVGLIRAPVDEAKGHQKAAVAAEIRPASLTGKDPAKGQSTGEN
jgi:hypothetical protein